MLGNLKIGLRLTLGFGVVIAMMIAIAVIGITRMSELNEETALIVNSRWPKSVMANTIIDRANEVGKEVRNVLLYTSEQEREKAWRAIEEDQKEIDELMAKLRETVVSDRGKELMATMARARGEYDRTVGEIKRQVEQGALGEAKGLLLVQFLPLARDYVTSIDELIKYQGEQVDAAGKSSAAIYESARTLMTVLAVSALALASLLALLITRSITRPLAEAVDAANRLAKGDLTLRIEARTRDETGRLLGAMSEMVSRLTTVIGEINTAAEALSSASEEVAATAQSLSQGATEQASSIEETSSSLEQMGSSVRQNADNAKVTDSIANSTSQLASQGGSAVHDTVEAMNQIADKIGIIEDIAYKTNLLALNAAIEAARAGEHGKGFAVVADEVRKLAERSQTSAQEISTLAAESVKVANRAGSLLEEIVPNIRKTADLVQEISAASEEQSAGVSQVGTAVTQLEKVAQQSASSSEELASTAEELSSQAQQLSKSVAFFRFEAATHQNLEPSAAESARRPAKSKSSSGKRQRVVDFEPFAPGVA